MRRLRYCVAASLDGFIADPKGAYDWIVTDPAIDFAATFREFDTFVMGRKTYEVMATGDFAGMLGKKEVIVFSRTLKSAPYPNVAIVDTAPADTIRTLKQKPGKDIWLFGGGELFRNLVEAGVVDTVEVGVMPAILSQGIPLLAPGKQIRAMKLAATKTYPSGVVMLSYALDSQ
jgi:dihydrofolate reductase